MNKISGIYSISSKCKPERIYVGSSVSIRSRWSSHKGSLARNKHGNKKLQYHYNKYGLNDLIFTFLIPCEREFLARAEQAFINFYKPWFNILPTAFSCSGKKMTEAQKKKIGDANRGKKRTEEQKLKASQSHRGLKSNRRRGVLSEESRKKISEAKRGNKNMLGKHHSPETVEKLRLKALNASEETRRKIGEAGRGRIPWNKGKVGVYSEETLKQMSKANKGRKAWSRGKKLSDEHKRKLRESHLGIVLSEVTRQRMSEASRGKPKSEETKKRMKEAWVKRKQKKITDDK